MPSVRVTNYTTSVLNISLKHVCAIHFENEVQPGQTVKLSCGKVWFTVEAQVDDGSNRYSLLKSAMTIGLVSVAAVATVAAAGAPLIASAAGTTVGAAASSAAPTIIAGLTAAAQASAAFVVANAETAAKISALLLPKALEAVQQEVGGFSEVQKEAIVILTAPTVAADLRKSGFATLDRFRKAHARDRKAASEREASESGSTKGGNNKKDKKVAEMTKEVSKDGWDVVDEKTEVKEERNGKKAKKEGSGGGKGGKKEWWKVMKLMSKDKEEEAEREKYAEEATKEGELRDKSTLRVHGISTWERRVFEIREKDGKMELFDSLLCQAL